MTAILGRSKSACALNSSIRRYNFAASEPIPEGAKVRNKTYQVSGPPRILRLSNVRRIGRRIVVQHPRLR
jgi:hypothetical protein